MKFTIKNCYYECKTKSSIYKCKSKKLNGYCTIKYNNGDRYFGYCLNNLYHGYGTLKKGDLIYFGNYYKGKRKGYGKVYDYINTILIYSGIWENKKYSFTNEIKWNLKLEKLIKYITDHDILPSIYNEINDEKNIAIWLNNQQTYYENKTNIMKNEKIYDKWTVFIEEYKKYFSENLKEKLWNVKFELLIKYIDENNNLPSEKSSNKEHKQLYAWLIYQKMNYKKNINIMKNINIYNKWTYFIEKYKQYFFSHEETWNNKLELLKNYINKNKQVPSYNNKNENIKKLSKWLIIQKTQYKNNTNIMKNIEIRNKWIEFIKEYQYYFKSFINKIKLFAE